MSTFHAPQEPAWAGPPAVSGGELLRGLRRERRLTLNDVVTRLEDAGLRMDTAHLQRIEASRISRPKQTTVDAIPTVGLGAPFRLRRDVLAAFGYRLDWTLPTGQELHDAAQLAQHELAGTTWPAYLMDYGQRLWVWNRYVPRLLGLPPDDPAPGRFAGLTLLDVLFDPAIGITPHIANAAAFRPLFLHMFRVSTSPHEHEPWLRELIARAHAWPGFTEGWEAIDAHPFDILRSQAIIPLEFTVPGMTEPMRFRLVSISLSLDPRFQVVHWMPFGARSLVACARWSEADGDL